MANGHDLDPVELLKCANRSKAARIAALEAWQAQATALLIESRDELRDTWAADAVTICDRIDALLAEADRG